MHIIQNLWHEASITPRCHERADSRQTDDDNNEGNKSCWIQKLNLKRRVDRRQELNTTCMVPEQLTYWRFF